MKVKLSLGETCVDGRSSELESPLGDSLSMNDTFIPDGVLDSKAVENLLPLCLKMIIRS
jgi:hypothetical protein